MINPTDSFLALRIRVGAHYLGRWSSPDAIRVFDPRSGGLELAREVGWRRPKPGEMSLLEHCQGTAADVELFTFPERLAVSVRALQGEDVARRGAVSDKYSGTLCEIVDFLAFAGVTITSRMLAWLQILKPRMALIGAQRPGSPGKGICETGERIEVTLMNFGPDPIECMFGQCTPKSPAILDCSVAADARAVLESFTWATPLVAIVMKACEGVTALDTQQLVGFSTRRAARDVRMMMAESCSQAVVA